MFNFCFYVIIKEIYEDALFSLGLFLGTGTTYALDHELTREQGITILVRTLGKDEEALSGNYSHPFTDVSEWADGYVGYCYTNNITNGTSPKNSAVQAL